jgi:cyclase
VLRKRLIAVLTLNDGVLFRTKLFRPDYRYTLNFVDAWSIDEIVVLDVTRSGEGDRANFDRVVRDFAKRCFVPLAAGGGVRSIEDVDRLLNIGADKIVINSGAIAQPTLITEIARRYGSQCVVVSIDAKPDGDGGYRVFADFGNRNTELEVEAWARRAQDCGAGEILVTAIERDGWLQGYDMELVARVVGTVSVPVLALGGCGNWQHAVELFKSTDAAGACTQNIYHFTEAAIRSAKSYLRGAGIDVRSS